ncbi:hypothetical protein N7474_009275 [Penicillium riverlandense]|uniref:uncharacterized protein n=1 Tax=Penicillium riverlandense TaxID=1903569 RepID=UPI0025465EB9|nr:uncharacterized protein N7474_009275 [Penicillium riverlandense]KAJ5808006.1 hypothetical protein N7474_009275 [Penicillium riverlandense]
MTQPSATFHHVDRSYYPLEQFLHRANADPDNKSYLRNLHQVYIMVDEAGELDDSDFYIHIEFLESFQMFDKLPSIESVGIDAFRDDDQDEPTIEQGTSNLSKLYINHSSLNTHCIARAILSCRVLKELQYSIEGRAEHERDMKGPLNERTFTKAILGHKTTLESLDVDVGKDTSYLDRGREDRIEDERESRVMDYDEEDEISQFLTSFWGNSGSLKDFGALKRLSLGIGLLLYLAKGVSGAPGEEEEQVMLADCLPDNLEYLCIRGYQRGEIEKCDAQIDALMAAYKSGLTGLKEIRGVEEMIRYAENVEDPDEDGDLLWTLEGAGYGR